jgi:hypothetical protein
MSMKGDKGASGESRLESGRDNFSRNMTDVFEIMASDIGAVQEVTMRLVRSTHKRKEQWNVKVIDAREICPSVLIYCIFLPLLL